ncbi:MAG: WD40 repeat domain-containing protein [Planctomycetia bacterium]|nr:WD40 repeat domain-containing protein [Planctomycetia bacterium]
MLGLTIGASCAAAPPQVAEGDKADWTWLRSEGTASLVLEPPQLKGVERWVLESPRHRGPINCLTVSPDGTRAATGGCDGVVRIWNLETGTLEKALVGHRYHLYSMDWSPDGTMLATHSWGDAKLIIWDIATGAMKKRFDKSLEMRSLRWSRDSRKLAGCTLGSGKISVVEGLGEPKVLTEIGQPIWALDWSPDATRLAVVAFGNVGSLIDASSGAAVTQLEIDGDEAFTMVRFSPEGKALATGNSASTSIWDAATGKRIATIKTPTADIAWSADGKQLTTTSSVGVKFWEGSDGKPAGGLPATGSLIEWNHASGRLVVAAADRVQAWDRDGKEAIVSIDAGGSAAPVFQAGKPVVTGVGTNALSLWDPVSFKRIGRLEGHAKPVTTAAWSQDGKRFASGSEDGTVRMWNVKNAESLHECRGHKGRITCLEWTADGKALVTASYDKTARIWSAEGEAKGTLEGHTSWIEAVAWSPNGKQVVTGGRDKNLIVWDAAQQAEAKKIEGTVPITALAWSAVKGVPALACGFQDGSIRVVNPSTGEVLAALATGNASNWYRTSALCWMPGNRPMLLASRYYLAQIWDVTQGKTVERQIAPGGASAVFPTAGGAFAVARSEDRTVRFWDPEGGKLRGVLLEEGDALVGISTSGDVKYDPDTNPGLIAIVQTQSGQQTISLDELAKTYGWKNNTKVMKLPSRN